MLIYLTSNSIIEKAIIYASLSVLKLDDAIVIKNDQELDLKVNSVKKSRNTIILESPVYGYENITDSKERANYIKKIKNLIAKKLAVIYHFPTMYTVDKIPGITSDNITNETNKLEELGLEYHDVSKNLNPKELGIRSVSNEFEDILAELGITISDPDKDIDKTVDKAKETLLV